MTTKNNDNDLLAAMGIAEENQREAIASPNEILLGLMEATSAIQMSLIAIQERQELLHKHVAYLLSKDVDFMANLEKQEAELAAKKAAENPGQEVANVEGQAE